MANNDKVPELTNSEFEDFIKKGIVLIDFFAEWCMPCLMMAPVLEDLSETFKEKIKIGKINVEENQALAEKFEVRSIPNLVLFNDGKVIDNFVGAIAQEELEEKLKAHLK